MKLSEFIEKLVAHNTVVYVFTETFIRDEDTYCSQFTLIGKYMDWQLGGNRDDRQYCIDRGFSTLPEDLEVIKIIGIASEFEVGALHTIDEIGIVVEDKAIEFKPVKETDEEKLNEQ